MNKALRMLVVGDSDGDVPRFKAALHAGGYEVAAERVATEEALRAAFREKPWDVVLSDYSMAELDAADVIRVRRELDIAVPLIVVSGTPGEDAAVATLKRGADDYLLKGNLGRLAPAVDAVLVKAAEKPSGSREHEKESARQSAGGAHAKSDFLTMVSHEIRTPMNGVLGFADLLVNAQNLPADCRNYAQSIVQSGESLLRVLDDIVDYVQLESGDIVVERAPFSPRQMLQEIRASLGPAAAEKRLKIHALMDDEVPMTLVGDAAHLRQILLNLASNAIKFTESGSVTLAMWPSNEPGTFEFSVKDTGAGLAAAQMARIFRPFAPTDSGPARGPGGIELGLTVCRRLVELLGGGLTVRSQPGVGSEFLIEMPLGTGEPEPDGEVDAFAPLDANFANRHPLTILLVEDDAVNLKLIITLMRRLGYEPLGAQNGREAVELYLAERPDFVLMDLQMPGMSGIEAAAKIRALERAAGRPRHVFIAALTANIFSAERQRCFDAGMNGYLNKPVKISSLARMLEQAGDFSVDDAP